jgi:hypothetical protein
MVGMVDKREGAGAAFPLLTLMLPTLLDNNKRLSHPLYGS